MPLNSSSEADIEALSAEHSRPMDIVQGSPNYGPPRSPIQPVPT